MTNIGKPIDDDYIDVEKRRADVSSDHEAAERDNIERGPRATQNADMSAASVDMSHVFDERGGSGSASTTDELIDENAIIENDGRSDTRTFFYPSEAADEHRYARLIRWQDGEGDPQRDVENRAADRRRAIDIFCGRLELGRHQRERIEHVTEGLNMSHMAHYASPQVILAIVSIVANEDGRFIRDEQVFRQLVEGVGTDLNELKNIRDLVRRKSERL